jgi:restriction system protein
MRKRRTHQNSSLVPSFDDLIIPTLRALNELGGSGTVNEISARAAEILRLPDEVLQVAHCETGQSEVEYRAAWARTYLRKVGLAEPSSRGVWALTSPDIDISKVNPEEIVRKVRAMSHEKARSSQVESDPGPIVTESETGEQAWREQLQRTLLAMSPAAFERLVQRLLRESGFVQVDVTGRSGDGGIDGIGIAQVAGFLSFTVMFQCKRYQGSVAAGQVRDFRGAMTGRTDKGIIITTGTFTRDAIKEATRDGAPPIDLIDGDKLTDRLKEYKLGINIKMVESVSVDEEWFGKV